jgi:hypothetical protein
MTGISIVFVILANKNEMSDLLFTAEDGFEYPDLDDIEDMEDLEDVGVYNTGIGKMFGISLIEEDYFEHLSTAKPQSPEEFFTAPGHELSHYAIATQMIVSLCHKYGVTSFNNLIIAGDTMAKKAIPGDRKPLAEQGHFAVYLGMFHNGAIFGESAADKKMIQDGWMPG